MLDDVGVVVIVLVIVLVLVSVIVLVVVLILVILMVVVFVILVLILVIFFVVVPVVLVVSKFHGNQTTAGWEFPPNVFFLVGNFPKIPDRFKLRNDTTDLRQLADFPWISVFGWFEGVGN